MSRRRKDRKEGLGRMCLHDRRRIRRRGGRGKEKGGSRGRKEGVGGKEGRTGKAQETKEERRNKRWSGAAVCLGVIGKEAKKKEEKGGEGRVEKKT